MQDTYMHVTPKVEEHGNSANDIVQAPIKYLRSMTVWDSDNQQDNLEPCPYLELLLLK